MSAVTRTASTAVSSQQPRIPRGAEAVERVQTYALTGTLSATDVILFPDLKVPHGALITDITVMGRIQFDGAATQIIEVGVAGGTADLFGSATLTGVYQKLPITTGAVLPYRVSVCDSATVRYIYPMIRADGNASASATASGTLTMIVRYIQDT
jgi:hypothetical protein